jgi:hypothetical protein
MGTRSTVIIFQDGKYKGYYNQYDGYPMGGVGEAVVKELKKIDRTKSGWDIFKAKCKNVKLVEDNQKPSAALQKKYVENGFYDARVASRSPEDWYCLLRELQGANYIKEIMAGRVEHMLSGGDFANSSLFCEYAYLIDLDKMVVEFYKGGQHKPQPGNRFGTVDNDGYFPCAKVGEIGLKKISKDSRAITIMEQLYNKAAEERENEN